MVVVDLAGSEVVQRTVQLRMLLGLRVGARLVATVELRRVATVVPRPVPPLHRHESVEPSLVEPRYTLYFQAMRLPAAPSLTEARGSSAQHTPTGLVGLDSAAAAAPAARHTASDRRHHLVVGDTRQGDDTERSQASQSARWSKV